MQRAHLGEDPGQGAEPWQRLEPSVAWSELILPADTVRRLQSVPALFSERFWTGSAAHAGPGSHKRGLLLLFVGPPGTGRTMATQALGHDLRLPVLEADLSALFARGRTEATQLLARLFATAERVGAVVLLGRAEPVLVGTGPELVAGGRVQTGGPVPASDARELLRRCEAYPGIVVVPTTDSRRLGPALLERFDLVAQFPLPDAGARAELWRRALGDAPVSASLLAFMAGAFALSGKAIAASAGRARLAAAAHGVEPGAHELADALEAEYGGRGEGAIGEALTELRARDWTSGAAADMARRLYAPAVPPEPAPVTPWGQTRAPAVPEPLARQPEPAPRQWSPAPRRPEPPARPPEPPVRPPEPPARPPEPPARPPERAPEPPRPERVAAAVRTPLWRRSGVLRVLPVAVIGAVAAIVLGLDASKQPTRTTTSSLTTAPLAASGSSGSVRFAYPAAWQLTTASPVHGLALQHAIELSATNTPSGQLIIGSDTGPLLPAQFVSATVPGAPVPQLITLGTHRFYRVLDPRLAQGAGSQSLYALPDGATNVIALCHTASRAFASSCERVLASLQLAPVKAPPGPSAAYARALNRVLVSLDGARSLDSRRLAAARTGAAQARAASALASAHTGAARTLAAEPAGSAAGANAALVRALRSAASAYQALARAAAGGNRTAYSRAARAVDAANAAIGAALAGLDRLGYAVR